MHHDPRDPKCPECYKEWQGEREAASMKIMEAMRRHPDYTAILEGFGLRGELGLWTFENYKPTCKGGEEALKVCREFAERPLGNLVMIGTKGTGKTHLAASICRATGGHYETATRLIRNIREVYGRGEGDTEQKRIDTWARKPLLVTDEIGMQKDEGSDKKLMFEIIDDRFIYRKPTVIVSNGTPEEVEASLGEKSMDRLARDGKILVMDWESWRRK